MIKKRNRKELYDKFRQGAIPSGADFADFIKSQMNLLDDGLDISDDPNDPINIRGKGEEENLLDFSDPENKKRWRISNRSEDASNEGLNIKADDRSRLFIDREKGNIGISTDQPEAKLTIKQIDDSDAIRIDDEGNDKTPFVITGEGKVGVGVGAGNEQPSAILHVNNPSPSTDDSLRVGDNEYNLNHLVINNSGNISMGFDYPSSDAKLAVDGSVSIGARDINPGDDGLYVKGNVRIDGNITFADDNDPFKGGIELDGYLKAKNNEVIITDNVIIKSDPEQKDEGSNGDLEVEGNTSLGTFDNNNFVKVNGQIISGDNPDPGADEPKKELVVNQILKVDRKVDTEKVTIAGNLDVEKSTVLGSNVEGDEIVLNGSVKRGTDSPVTIDHDFKVNRNTILGNEKTDDIQLNGTVSSAEGIVDVSASVNIDNDLTINGNSTLGSEITDTVYINGVISSALGNVKVNDSMDVESDLTINGSTTLTNTIFLDGNVKSNLDDITVDHNLKVNGQLRFDDNENFAERIVNAVTTDDSAALPTEKAVKEYIDTKYNELSTGLLQLQRDIRYATANAGAGQNSYIDIPALDGYTMEDLVFCSVSPKTMYMYDPSSGYIDDTIAERQYIISCWAEIRSNCIRCYIGNNRQQQPQAWVPGAVIYATVAFYGLWKN